VSEDISANRRVASFQRGTRGCSGAPRLAAERYSGSHQDRRLFAEIDEVSAAVEQSARHDAKDASAECRRDGGRGEAGWDRSRSIELSSDLSRRGPAPRRGAEKIA